MLLAPLLAATALAASAFQEPEPLSRGVALDGGSAAEGPSGYTRRHALVIGIDSYEDPAFPDLGYAVADARAVAKVLVDDFGFAADDVRLILDEDATQDALAKALEEWAADERTVGANDLFVVFFAGHGVTRELGSRGQRGYLVPVDGESSSQGRPAWSSLVGMNEMEDVSEAIPAKHVLFVLDCCFGGLAVKRAAPPVAAGLSNRARQVITAGNAQQAVLDTGGGGHSVFTGALLGGLAGDADLDGDGVITFGELYNHVGREVERKTEERQTPLQATLPDHEGGNVALFPPGLVPGQMTAAQRLKALERTSEERLAELERLADYILVLDLQSEADELWPQVPKMVPRYRGWLSRARDVLGRRETHEASVRLVRQEAYLSQVLTGEIAEGEGTEPVWSRVDPKLRWRFETFERLVAGLDELEALLTDVQGRLDFASTQRERTVDAYAQAWEESIEAAAGFAYGGLELTPQVGLVPLGTDPESGLLEFCDVQTGAVPERGADDRLLVSGETGLVFVLLPGGTFQMGATRDPDGWNHDPQARHDEGPVHEVTLSPLLISKYEMTQGQWQRFTGVNSSRYRTTPAHPVEQVSWLDCMDVVGRMGLVLPSEAQWEYAARAGSEAPWWRGPEKEALVEVANLADGFCRANGGPDGFAYEEWDDGHVTHAPVGNYLPNAFGLFDVHGNVWEWCLDGYGSGFYAKSPALDPVAPHAGADYRVSRGGGFSNAAALARSATRAAYTPSYADLNLGLRPARVITK